MDKCPCSHQDNSLKPLQQLSSQTMLGRPHNTHTLHYILWQLNQFRPKVDHLEAEVSLQAIYYKFSDRKLLQVRD